MMWTLALSRHDKGVSREREVCMDWTGNRARGCPAFLSHPQCRR
jgi:hypothetical protein